MGQLWTSDSAQTAIEWIFTTISCIALIAIFVRTTWQLLLKTFNNEYKFHLSIKPPSATQSYYLQLCDLLLFISKCFIIPQNLLACSLWSKYCYELIEDTDNSDQCRNDNHCQYTWIHGCHPLWNGVEIIRFLIYLIPMSMGVLELLCGLICTNKQTCGDNWYRIIYCMIKRRYKTQQRIYYEDKQLFQSKLEWIKHFNNISFFILIFGFYGIYNGPNKQEITDLHTILSLCILWIYNEIFVKCIGYRRYPNYNVNNGRQYVLELLTDKLGDGVARIVWNEYLEQNEEIGNDEEIIDGIVVLNVKSRRISEYQLRQYQKRMMMKHNFRSLASTELV